MLDWLRARAPTFGESPGAEATDEATAAQADEAKLVARARIDRAAFGELYERHVQSVYQFCFRRLGSREAAEDATSQTFLKVMIALPSYRETAAFRGWLFTIANNVVLDLLRQRRPNQPIDLSEALVDPAPLPEQVALTGESQQSVQSLLAELPDDQRRVVELRLAGLKGPEIAAALGRTLGSVKMLQLRAIQRLRGALNGQSAAETSPALSRPPSFAAPRPLIGKADQGVYR